MMIRMTARMTPTMPYGPRYIGDLRWRVSGISSAPAIPRWVTQGCPRTAAALWHAYALQRLPRDAARQRDHLVRKSGHGLGGATAAPARRGGRQGQPVEKVPLATVRARG